MIALPSFLVLKHFIGCTIVLLRQALDIRLFFRHPTQALQEILMSVAPASTLVIAQCTDTGHMGLPYPLDASDASLRAFVVFWEGLGCVVEVVPSSQDVEDPNIWYPFREKY